MSVNKRTIEVPREIVEDVHQELIKGLVEAQDTITLNSFELQAIVEYLEKFDLMRELVEKPGIGIRQGADNQLVVFDKETGAVAVLLTRYLNSPVPVSQQIAQETAQNQVDRKRVLELITSPDVPDESSIKEETTGVMEILDDLGEKSHALITQRVEEMLFLQQATQGLRPC